MAQYNRFGQNEKELAGGGSTGPAAPATEFRALVVTGGTEVDIDDVRVSGKVLVHLFSIYCFCKDKSASPRLYLSERRAVPLPLRNPCNRLVLLFTAMFHVHQQDSVRSLLFLLTCSANLLHS